MGWKEGWFLEKQVFKSKRKDFNSKCFNVIKNVVRFTCSFYGGKKKQELLITL